MEIIYGNYLWKLFMEIIFGKYLFEKIHIEYF
jgi:hypothetical protein